MNSYLIILVFIVLAIIIFLINYEPFFNSNYDILLDEPNETIKTINIIKHKGSTVIPLNIFITWNTKELSPSIEKAINTIIFNNSEFNLYIYDDEDCRNFLKKYFIPDVVNAFDSLIPGAYKADLWRYCVLYYYGGIYQDIKYYPVGKFKYINLTDKEYFVRDRDLGGGGVYNGLLVCKPNNTVLYKCINRIIIHVKRKFYGSSPLEPTGPLLMKKFVSKNDMKDCLKFTVENGIDYILKDNNKILQSIKEYRNEQNKGNHYNKLYFEKKIYK